MGGVQKLAVLAVAAVLAVTPCGALANEADADGFDDGFYVDMGSDFGFDEFGDDQDVSGGDDVAGEITFDIAGGNVYTGSEVTPAVRNVRLGDELLTVGVDYTVAYTDNLRPGTAYVTVSPAGSRFFTAKKLSFAIGRLPLSQAKVVLGGAGITYSDGAAATVYDGTQKNPAATVTCNGIKLKEGADYTVSYADNVAVGTATVTVTASASGVCSGHVSVTFSITEKPASHDDSYSNSGTDSGMKETVTRVTMTRLYNKYSGEHLYTSDADEVADLTARGWKNEGTAWVAPSVSSTPVYRLYNPYSGDHLFTTDEGEYAKCQAAGWNGEGIAWYSADSASGVAVYRGFNRFVKVGTHHYTADQGEMGTMEAHGWVPEGIAWYGLK